MHPVKRYFEFTKREYNGFLVLFIGMLLVCIAPYSHRYLRKEPAVDFQRLETAIAQLQAAERKWPTADQERSPSLKQNPAAAQLFTFNPNNLPVVQWKKLGLSQKQIQNIKNYERKGGKFYRKEDLAKIYTISEEEYQRLQAFIHIPSAKDERKKTHQSTKEYRPLVEINEADSAKLTELRGIGPAFASKIVRYRSRLGGFHKKEQLLEVYNLDSARYALIKDHISVNSLLLNKIPINTITFKELQKNPYLSYKQTYLIINYRDQHGHFHTLDDLKPIALLSDTTLSKLSPYLDFSIP